MLFRSADGLHAAIGLDTYHKYLKATHSPVPLDTHGNPLPQGGARGFYKPRCGSSFLLRKALLGSTKALVRKVARRGEGMKKGSNEGRGVGVTSSSIRESIALWDKRGISHIPVYLCDRKRFGEVEEAADSGLRRNDPVAALIDTHHAWLVPPEP